MLPAPSCFPPLQGEGALWNAALGEYMHVDILGKAVYTHNVETGALRKYAMPSVVGTVVPRKGGNAVVALQDGFAFLDLASGAVRHIVNPEPHAHVNRFNDGKVGPDGVFRADEVLAKHDENYLPPEAAEALKRAGKPIGAGTVSQP